MTKYRPCFSAACTCTSSQYIIAVWWGLGDWGPLGGVRRYVPFLYHKATRAVGICASFFGFVGLLIFFQVPQKIKSVLEENITNIKNQINLALLPLLGSNTVTVILRKLPIVASKCIFWKLDQRNSFRVLEQYASELQCL